MIGKQILLKYLKYYNDFSEFDNIENGNAGILLADNQVVGTGCCLDNHITRVYVLPKFQRKGYGSFIMQCLEDEISAKYDKVLLDASLPASHLYEQRGYYTIEHKKWFVENNVVLVYEVMEKELIKTGLSKEQ